MQGRQDRFIQAIRSKFVTLPGEELILVQRKHPWVFILPVSASLIFGLISFAASFFIYPFVSNYPYLFISTFFLVLIFISTITIRSIIDWHFNFYVATNKKIIEVAFKPLSSREISEVLLDQVKCTEIDTKINGIVNEFLDIGDVIITFDRPTHQEEFVFTDVEDPKRIETHLENALCLIDDHHLSGDGETGWFNKQKQDPSKWRYTERIIPRRGGDMLWNT